MGKFRIVIDSTVYLPHQYIKDNQIKVVSLNVSDQMENVYKESSISREFIIDKQNEGVKFKTSAPAPGAFLMTYQELLDEGADAVFYIGLSKELSGTYQSALLGRNMLDDPGQVVCFDTNQSAYGNENLVYHLVDLINQSADYEAIVKEMNAIIDNAQLFFTCENLFSLVRGGRLTVAKALIGSVLRVKPIIKMVDGKLGLYTTKRTYKKVYQVIMDEIHATTDADHQLHLIITHTYSKKSAEGLYTLVKEAYPDAVIRFTDLLGPVMTVHVGNKGFGVSWFTTTK